MTRFWLCFCMFKITSHTSTTELDQTKYVSLQTLYCPRVKYLGKINLNNHSNMACFKHGSAHLSVPQQSPLALWLTLSTSSQCLYGQLGLLEIKKNLVRHYVQWTLKRNQQKWAVGAIQNCVKSLNVPFCSMVLFSFVQRSTFWIVKEKGKPRVWTGHRFRQAASVKRVTSLIRDRAKLGKLGELWGTKFAGFLSCSCGTLNLNIQNLKD